LAQWDRSTDVVVVGSGAAAFAAAATAASAGRTVLMLERAAAPGGTTYRSGGGYWIPNNRFMRAAGTADPRDAALRFMAKLAYPYLYDPTHPALGLSENQHSLIAAFFDRASTAIDELERLGVLHSQHDPLTPDYNADLPEDLAPYGRYVNPTAKPASPLDHGNGVDMIEQMHAGCLRLGVELLCDHRVVHCLRGPTGEVVGVEVEHPGGTLRVGARHGVVFGSGGFLHNPEMRTDFLRGPIFGGCGAITNTGDFVRIGIELGADLANMSQAWWAQVVLEEVLDNPSPPKNVWIPFGDSMVLVNGRGQRVVNEKMTYNERGQVHFLWDAGGREYPNLLLFMIYDDAVAQNPVAYNFRRPVPMPGDPNPYLITGSDWEDLAARIRERLAAVAGKTGGYALAADFVPRLRETVARFNGFAEQGYDPDFHRGETPIQLAWGGPLREGNEKNACMYPFRSEGPYHCFILAGGGLDTKGGPRTDARARVLDLEGQPIPGLYGAGNCVASPAGQAYWSAGTTLGLCLTFGYLAGRGVSTEPARDLAETVAGSV
jgi:succinate dehydrogenase/fumarate reductase flavoprotein subunit